MPEFKIVDVQDVPAIAPERQGRTDKLVKYDVGDGRRRYLRLPAEGATEASIVAAIRKDLAAATAIVGKTYPH